MTSEQNFNSLRERKISNSRGGPSKDHYLNNASVTNLNNTECQLPGSVTTMMLSRHQKKNLHEIIRNRMHNLVSTFLDPNNPTTQLPFQSCDEVNSEKRIRINDNAETEISESESTTNMMTKLCQNTVNNISRKDQLNLANADQSINAFHQTDDEYFEVDFSSLDETDDNQPQVYGEMEGSVSPLLSIAAETLEVSTKYKGFLDLLGSADPSSQEKTCFSSAAELVRSPVHTTSNILDPSLPRPNVSLSSCKCLLCLQGQDRPSDLTFGSKPSVENNVEHCPNCGELKTLKYMLHHINAVHRGLMYKCPECQDQFKCQIDLKTHYSIEHSHSQIPDGANIDVVYTMKPKFHSKEDFLSWNTRFRTNNRTSKSEWCTLCCVTMRRNTRRHFELNHGIDKYQCISCTSWHHTKLLALRHCSKNRHIGLDTGKKKPTTQTESSVLSGPKRQLRSKSKLSSKF